MRKRTSLWRWVLFPLSSDPRIYWRRWKAWPSWKYVLPRSRS